MEHEIGRGSSGPEKQKPPLHGGSTDGGSRTAFELAEGSNYAVLVDGVGLEPDPPLRSRLVDPLRDNVSMGISCLRGRSPLRQARPASAGLVVGGLGSFGRAWQPLRSRYPSAA